MRTIVSLPVSGGRTSGSSGGGATSAVVSAGAAASVSAGSAGGGSGRNSQNSNPAAMTTAAATPIQIHNRFESSGGGGCRGPEYSAKSSGSAMHPSTHTQATTRVAARVTIYCTGRNARRHPPNTGR